MLTSSKTEKKNTIFNLRHVYTSCQGPGVIPDAFCILFGVAVVLTPGLNLVNAMVRAQMIQGVLLPVILIFMLKLINREDVMGKHTNGPIYNVFVWAIAVFLIVMTLASTMGAMFGL